MLLFISSLYALGNAEGDKYIGMSVEQVIDELGPPTFRVYQVIDRNHSITPIEPYYPNYFSEAELEESVVINFLRWVKGRRNTLVWAKMIEGKWIVFNSLSYKESPFVKY
jgi:hypothetical protein